MASAEMRSKIIIFSDPVFDLFICRIVKQFNSKFLRDPHLLILKVDVSLHDKCLD